MINHQFPSNNYCKSSGCQSEVVDNEPVPNVASSSESEQPEGEVESEKTREIQVGGYSEDIVSQQAVKITLKLCFLIVAVILAVHVQKCVKSQSDLASMLSPVILQLHNIYTVLTILHCV